MKVLDVKELNKKYPKFHLKDVTFSMEQGKIMGFIGRNGAGKTTTMKSMLNLVHPDSGEVRFFDLDIAEHEFEIKQRLSFILGAANFYSQSKIKTITDVYRRFYPTWDDAAYQSFLTRFELDPEKKLKELSQGMSIKYALALGLSHHADLLILDEPTSGLDPVSRDEILNIFEDIVDSEGAGILFSTHITSDLDKCADEITYIKDGEVLTSEGKDSFLDSYRLVEGTVDQLADGQRNKIIGMHERNGGFSGLVRKSDAGDFQTFDIKPADLESIMVHIERR